ncbi:hypothetical protein [Fructobacillus tropaeoli]|uniref:Uncharacterized protein n=1 Tax=Fructobacillus tropaeoli TaxID=709323 RepID=A0A3F3HIT1_9LACO|nr:hypothetical protein [Fructobacillus tropaeoli]GAP05053.1 hypothetical protein FTRO_0300020 [Fructobacillus tropaeoli]
MKYSSMAGYSPEMYQLVFGNDNRFVYLCGEGPREKRSWDNESHSYGDVEALVVELYAPGKGVVRVKLPVSTIVDVKDLSWVSLINPEAFVDGKKKDVYLRADGLEVLA